MRHFLMMLIGFILYPIIYLPLSWWADEDGLLWWALPLIGYYAYQPSELGWFHKNEPCER